MIRQLPPLQLGDEPISLINNVISSALTIGLNDDLRIKLVIVFARGGKKELIGGIEKINRFASHGNERLQRGKIACSIR